MQAGVQAGVRWGQAGLGSGGAAEALPAVHPCRHQGAPQRHRPPLFRGGDTRMGALGWEHQDGVLGCRYWNGVTRMWVMGWGYCNGGTGMKTPGWGHWDGSTRMEVLGWEHGDGGAGIEYWNGGTRRGGLGWEYWDRDTKMGVLG